MKKVRNPVLILTLVAFASLPACLCTAENIVSVGSSSELVVALTSVAEGDVLELAGGDYLAPSGGFQVNDAGVNFTVKAAAQAAVSLSGNGNGPVFVITNSAVDISHTIVFENLDFSDGFSSDPQIGGGVTLIQAGATFSECSFMANVSTGALTGGGAVFMRDGAVAHFFDCSFSQNTAVKEGGAIRLRNGCSAWVTNCSFSNNATDVPNHDDAASGGAINLYNSSIKISNTLFDHNRSGCFGGAIYVKGIFDETSDPTSTILITNSTFRENTAEPDITSSCKQPSIAGALHLENDVEAEIYSSRFLENSAEMGGALGNYRGTLDLSDCVFRGNLAFGGDGSGVGGALHSNSNDTTDGSTNDGAINRPSARITVDHCLFQGSWGTTTAAANKGGCVYIRGDSNRSYGTGGVPQDGDADQNRAVLTVTNSAFVQCNAGYSEDGDGGAMALNHVKLDCSDSVFLANDGLGDTGNGGAMRLTLESDAAISNCYFQQNQGGNRAAVFMLSGSDLEVDDSVFIHNIVRNGAKGSVLWSTPTAATSTVPALDVHGYFNNSELIENDGWDIAETDFATGPINAMTYSGNSFLTDPTGGYVFNSTLNPGGQDVASLNSYVANRNIGVGNTDKAPSNNNLELSSAPFLGFLRALPSYQYSTAAPTDSTPTEAFLAAAWFGGTATLDGNPLSGSSGWQLTSESAGNHSLDIGGGSLTKVDTILAAPTPAMNFIANPDVVTQGQATSLEWETLAGDWLEITIDRGTSIPTTAPTSSVSVTPTATKEFRALVLTKQGGVSATTKVWVDEFPPGVIFKDGFESGFTTAWTTTVG